MQCEGVFKDSCPWDRHLKWGPTTRGPVQPGFLQCTSRVPTRNRGADRQTVLGLTQATAIILTTLLPKCQIPWSLCPSSHAPCKATLP